MVLPLTLLTYIGSPFFKLGKFRLGSTSTFHITTRFHHVPPPRSRRYIVTRLRSGINYMTNLGFGLSESFSFALGFTGALGITSYITRSILFRKSFGKIFSYRLSGYASGCQSPQSSAMLKRIRNQYHRPFYICRTLGACFFIFIS